MPDVLPWTVDASIGSSILIVPKASSGSHRAPSTTLSPSFPLCMPQFHCHDILDHRLKESVAVSSDRETVLVAVATDVPQSLYGRVHCTRTVLPRSLGNAPGPLRNASTVTFPCGQGRHPIVVRVGLAFFETRERIVWYITVLLKCVPGTGYLVQCLGLVFARVADRRLNLN